MAEHNKGVPILVETNKEGEASFLEDIHNEMLKRLVFFLLLPAVVLFSSILWLTFDWPGIIRTLFLKPTSPPRLKKTHNLTH